MRAEYISAYYTLERENWWFLARAVILRDQLKRQYTGRNDLRILNIGAAFGASTVMLQEFGTVVSVEYNPECFAFLRAQLKLDVVQASITDLPFPDADFDLVCAFDVVEHVADHEAAVQEMFRVCRTGGQVFATVPAFQWLWSPHDVLNEHHRRYNKKQFLSLFGSMSILFHSYFNFFLFPPTALFRLLFSGKTKSEQLAVSDNQRFSGPFLSRWLYRIFRSETQWLRKGRRFPFGVSIMVMASKL
ncbi:MAG: hypothetical protein DI538_26915 [Azospira oryzae]|nr:MAG: hypothetical protein DI538_26915 [Azospira oryzae]